MSSNANKLNKLNKLTFRVDQENSRHVHFTVFENGANTGSLVFDRGAFFHLCEYLLGMSNEANKPVFSLIRDDNR